MYSQPLVDAIAEAERLVAAAPFIESEADLHEGLQYLAGCISGCTHLAFDYERDHPFMQSGTGPFTKMGLDNPDTLYFGTRVQPDHEYVVTGKRGSTTDLSFQMLGGEYTDDNVPVSEAAFDDRELDIADDGTFEWRVTPNGPSQLLVREVYNDWSAQRGYISVARTDTAGTAPPPLTQSAHREALCRCGQATGSAGQDLAAVPAVVLQHAARQHHGRAPPDAGRAGHPVFVSRALRPEPGTGDRHHAARHRCAVSRVSAGQPLVHLTRLHQPPDFVERHSGAGRSGRQDPDRGVRRQPRRNQLGAKPSGTARVIFNSAGSGCRAHSPRTRARPSRCSTAAEVPGALPYYDSNKISEGDWRARIALRQKQIANRMVG